MISNQITDRKSHYVSDVTKLDALMDKTSPGPSGTNVPRLSMCRSIISLRKITNQMWRDHPFSQKNKATKRAVRRGGEGAVRNPLPIMVFIHIYLITFRKYFCGLVVLDQ